MIPQTYPSTYETYNGRTSMVVYELTSVIGLTEWIDYIPVKNALPSESEINTYENNGAIQIDSLSSSTGLQAWLNYIPVYQKSTGTAWVDYIPVYRSSTFTAVLTNSVILRNGFGAPTYTRATTATVTDNEDVIRPVLSGEVRFQGARRVRNFVGGSSNDLSNASWTKAAAGAGSVAVATGNYATAPDGTTTASRLVLALNGGTAAGDSSTASATITGASGSTVRDSIWLKSNTASSYVVFIRNSGTTVAAVTVTTEWQRFSAGTATASDFQIGLRGNNYGGATNSNSADILVWGAQLEAVTGQSNQNPSEYVSVGAAKLNDFTYAQELSNAAWTKTRSSITTSAEVSSDGVTTMFKLVEDATAANSHLLRQTVTIPAGAEVRFSVEAKAGEREYIALQVWDATFARRALQYFNLTTGAVGATSVATYSVTSASITALGSGKYRCEAVIQTSTDTSVLCDVNLASSVPATSYNGDGVSGAYLTKLQIAQSGQPATYFPVANVYPYHGAMVDGVKYFDTTNGNTVSSNVVTEASGSPISAATLKGYLAEGARTNLCLQSEDFGTTWANSGSSESTNATTAPDGAATADKLVESATTAQHFIFQSVTKAASSIAYSFTLFLKAAERTRAQMFLHDGAGNGYLALIDLSGGTIGSAQAQGTGWSAPTTSITAYPNGWYRCEVAATSNTATAVELRVNILTTATANESYLGNGTSGIYLWGAQLEAGIFPSSYIPTTTASVVRNADVLTYQFAGNADATVGSAYAEVSTLWAGTFTSNSAMIISYAGLGGPLSCQSSAVSTRVDMFDGTTVVSKTGLSDFNTGVRKVASSYGGSTMSVTGGSATPASGSFDGNMGSTSIAIACDTGGIRQLFGTIRNARIYQNQFTSAQLQAVTS